MVRWLSPHAGSTGRVLWSVTCIAVVLAGSCTSTQGADSPSAASPASSIDLKVMTFNIRYGGRYDFDQVMEAIRAADADVVGMQEPYGRISEIADALDWYVSLRLHVISRFPILEPTDGGQWGFVQVAPGRVVVMANTHLPSTPYGPYLVRKGDSLDRVLEDEGDRLDWATDLLDAVAPVLDGFTPMFLTGDFNSPSYRDWTAAVSEVRPEVPYPVEWPVSKAMEDAGFVDSYRAAHPDPLADPGFTWTPGTGEVPVVKPDEVFDRIDFVWAAGVVDVLDSDVVGEAGGPVTDIAVDPWPSDHRGVVSTFRLTPVVPPVFVAVSDARVEQGSPFDVYFHAPGEPGEHIAITPESSATSAADAPTGDDAPADGLVPFESTGFQPGAYTAALLDAGGTTIADVSFVVVDPDAAPTIVAAKDEFAVGEAIEVSWTNGLGNRNDWIALTAAGKSARSYLTWRYIDARVLGTASIGRASDGTWPLPPGEYQVHLCTDDSYTCIASTQPFSVFAY